MTQIVARHYANPVARRHLWTGLLMSAVGISFGIERAASYWPIVRSISGI